MDHVPFEFCQNVLACIRHNTQLHEANLLPPFWEAAAKTLTELSILHLTLYQRSDAEWHYEIRKFSPQDVFYTLDEVLAMDLVTFRFRHVSFSVIEGSGHSILAEKLNQVLIPLVTSQLCDPAELRVAIDTNCNVLFAFSSLTRTKILFLPDYNSNCEAILTQKTTQNSLESLVLEGAWPDSVQDMLAPLATSPNFTTLDLSYSSLNLTFEIVEPFLMRWKQTPKISLIVKGRMNFEPEKIGEFFEGEEISELGYGLHVNINHHCLACGYYDNNFQMNTYCLMDCGCI